MAGDWIKMTIGLRTHPKIVRMACALKSDKLRVIGALFSVWSVFDQHSADGRLVGYSLRAMDDEIGWRGFSAAMHAIGWLEEDDEGLLAPRFDDHNGKSAKRRAQETDRKRTNRSTKSGQISAPDAGDGGQSNGQMSASYADKLRSREEKRRSKPPLTPPRGECVGFRSFWDSWPVHRRKVD